MDVQAKKPVGVIGRNPRPRARSSGLALPAQPLTFYSLRLTPHGSPEAFTLIELLLVMTIIVTTIAIAAPTLGNFFRGRTLDSEARRLLALTHSGQNRAIYEGIPTRLWLDVQQHAYGLEEDPGWSDRDPKAVQFAFDSDLQIDVVHSTKPATASSRAKLPPAVQSKSKHASLPEIRFLPDGTIDSDSPLALHLEDRSGTSLWLAEATNRLSYEIRSTFDPGR